MTFSFEQERLTAFRPDGIPVGHIAFPRIRAGLVNVSQTKISPAFRGQGVEDVMMNALFSHLDQENQKVALTCPAAQQYIQKNPQWSHLLPGKIHMTAH